MGTVRRFPASARGPVTFHAKLAAGEVLVRTESVAGAEIVVSTDDDSGPSADAVNKARFTERGNEIRIELPSTGMNVGGVNIAGGSVVFGSGDVTIVNGRVVGGNGMVVQTGGSPIYIAALLPTNSSVDFDTESADVTTEGRVAHVSGKTMSGGVTIQAAASAAVKTMSGAIRIDSLGGDARLESMSGDVRVHAAVPCRIHANNMSGDVTVTGARVQLDGRSMSGRVRQL